MMTSRRDERGSALVVVMIVVTVVSALVVFMLEDATLKMGDSTRAIQDAKGFNLAEAGVDLSISELNNELDGKLGTAAWNPGTDDLDKNGFPDVGAPNVRPLRLATGTFHSYAIPWFTDGVDNDGVNGVDDAGEEGLHTIYCVAQDFSEARFGNTTILHVIVYPQPNFLFRMALFADKGMKVQGT
ncbi:MAG: hypothetical protein ACYTGB_14155, partial [Planctomycetota bacterium]